MKKKNDNAEASKKGPSDDIVELAREVLRANGDTSAQWLTSKTHLAVKLATAIVADSGEPFPSPKILTGFVRARNEDGTIQIGFADPELPFGQRAVEVKTISSLDGFILIQQIAHALSFEQKPPRPRVSR